jgi:hypothetical protein
VEVTAHVALRGRTVRSISACALSAGYVKIESLLQVHPELAGGGKVAGEPQGRVGADRVFSIDDGAYACDWNMQSARQSVDGDSRRLHELFEQDLPGVNRIELGHFPLFWL